MDRFYEIKIKTSKKHGKTRQKFLLQYETNFYSLLSFSAKKITKFKDWLGIGTNIDIKASTAVIEILSNLAYETVNEVSVIIV